MYFGIYEVFVVDVALLYHHGFPKSCKADSEIVACLK
jgi:hypothetical protein